MGTYHETVGLVTGEFEMSWPSHDILLLMVEKTEQQSHLDVLDACYDVLMSFVPPGKQGEVHVMVMSAWSSFWQER